MMFSRNKTHLLGIAVAGMLLAHTSGVLGMGNASRVTSCTGPASDGDNENCKLVLFPGEKFEIEAAFASYAPYKGTADSQELCPGASPLGTAGVTGQCELTALTTPTAYFKATVDPTAKSTANGEGLVFTMPATVESKKEAYTVNIKVDNESAPIKRFVTTLISTTSPYPSSAFAPAFKAATALLSASAVAVIALMS